MRKTAQILVFFILLFSVSIKNVEASGCSVSISPSEALINSTRSYTLSVSNSGDSPIQFVKIPTGFDSNFTVGDVSGSGWDLSLVSGGYGMVGGSISPGSSADFSVGGSIGGSEGSIAWILEASESGDGSNSFSCSSVSINIVNELAPTPIPESTPVPESAPGISNISVAASSSTATITWSLDRAATSAIVYYGTTTSYGSSKSSGSGDYERAYLTGLSASTTYHYQIQVTGVGGTTIVSDNTFTTAAAGTTTVLTTTVTNVTTNTVTKTLTDTTAPSIRFKTIFNKIYEKAPLTEMVVTDGTGIARIEYSIDGGINWMPVDLDEQIGAKRINSSFTPNIVEDGDYSLLVRAIDTGGNKQLSKEVKFTIDRLPPRIGPLTIMVGPLIINSRDINIKDLLVGVEYKFILTAAGGPNKISMSCDDMSFDFNKNVDSGVWISKVKFSKSGECGLILTSVDGAGNTQTIDNQRVSINNLGTLKNGKITVYWYDDFEKKFVVWDASPYGQVNPIDTGEQGGYSILLPKGKYYLEAKSKGMRTIVSNIITVSETAYINDSFSFSPIWKFWQLAQEQMITPKVLGSVSWNDANFPLPKVVLGELSTLDIRGKTSVVSLLSSWHPDTNSYLKELISLSQKKVSVYPILVQEKDFVADAVKRRGDYGLPIYADPDGELIKDVVLNGLPTTWIVNKFGQVVKQKVGIIDAQEIIDQVSKSY